ncbi:hypothetical protein V2O64_05090 [Verrucomicrobiaceae bacterium 227]
MKKALPFLVLSGLAIPAFANNFRDFTDAKGRTISAEIVTVIDELVTIKRKDGKTFTVSSSTFSEGDQTFIEKWLEQNEAENARQKAAAEVTRKRAKIAQYCVSQKGQQVGNGECWSLANSAYNDSQAKRPEGQLRVWGRLLDLDNEKIEPGDVVEFRSARIPGYGTTGEAHTAVAIEGGRSKRCTVAEQNIGGVKKVRFTELDLRKIDSGEVMVYRLEK